MKTTAKILTLLLLTPLQLIGAPNKPNLQSNEDCILIVKKSGFSSYFPLNNLNEFPVNNKTHPQYYWMTEVGNLKNGSFIPNNFAYSASIPRGQKEAKYSLQDLIKQSIESLHFSSSTLNKENKNQIQFGGFSLMPLEDGLMIVSENTNYYEKLFSQKPSHALLTFKSLDSRESYSCLTKINYLN